MHTPFVYLAAAGRARTLLWPSLRRQPRTHHVPTHPPCRLLHARRYRRDAASRVGKNTEACFARRSLPSDEQPRAWLNTTVLLREMERIHRIDWERPAESLLDNGWARDEFETTMHEDLFGHETDGSDAAFETAVHGWKATLRSLGVEPDDDTVREALGTQRGSRPAAQLKASVVNADAVAATLAQAGAPFSNMVPGA